MPITKDEMWKRVEQIEEVKNSINKLVGITEDVHKNVGELSVLVKGNGEPEKGLFYRVADLRKDFTSHCELSNLTQEAITEAVKAALPSRRDVDPKELPPYQRAGRWFRLFSKQISLIVWILALIVVGFLYLEYGDEVNAARQIMKELKPAAVAQPK